MDTNESLEFLMGFMATFASCENDTIIIRREKDEITVSIGAVTETRPIECIYERIEKEAPGFLQAIGIEWHTSQSTAKH